MQRIIRCGILALILTVIAGRPQQAQTPEGKKKDEKGKAAAAPYVPTEREKKVLALFNATTKRFKDGKISLEYSFEGRQAAADDLVNDFRPALSETRNRVRWSKAAEGYWSTNYEQGLLIGDYGEWLHKAAFLNDVEMKVTMVRVSAVRPGTLVATVFHNPKKKLSIGVNSGYQAVCLKGWAQAKPPHPKTDKPLPQSHQRFTAGYRLNGKVLESQLNNRKTSDTAAAPKFTDGFDTGHPGLAWSGAQCFILNLTIEGRLDPDWVAAQLGEKSEKSPEGQVGMARPSRSR
jgi:hypothetical protein